MVDDLPQLVIYHKYVMRKWINLFENKENTPAFLYHGTSRDRWNYISGEGLVPRRGSNGTWVFLTDSLKHASAYADYAVDVDEDKGVDPEENGALVLVIDVTGLDPSKLGPDDYELQDMIDRKDTRLAGYSSWKEVPWRVSLDVCHQVTYEGIIPASLIKPL